MAERMIHEMDQLQKRASKTQYSWHASVKSQAIFVRMSSDVDERKYILTTNGVRKNRQVGYIQGDLSMFCSGNSWSVL
jgi:hypothetical protein